ncbi:MAG: response regulator [Opitutaceae bacterium]|nr:response regulator [Opitutaceae bacterium]
MPASRPSSVRDPRSSRAKGTAKAAASNRALRILHLEDNPSDVGAIRDVLQAEWPECRIACVSRRQDFIHELQQRGCDVILSDFSLHSFNGRSALRLAREISPETPFIFLSGAVGEDQVIEALRSGAEDYVLKDRLKGLPNAITRVLREGEERRRLREAELRSRELADLLNQAREGIFITDLENRVIYWNAGAERIFGWRSVEVLNRPVGEIFGDDVPFLREETLTKGEWSGELRMFDRQRKPIVIESRQSLIRGDAGRAKARLAINADITEQKRLEEQFLRAQRMENIGLLAVGIAHDLNNMLAPILLAAPMLRDHVSDPTALGVLSTLEKSADRGANLVRQILSFVQGSATEKVLIPVRHLVRDIVLVVNGTFPKSVRLIDHIAPDLWSIVANPTQIHQVMLNLCVNARDAMPEGGTLRLRAENVVLDAAAARAIDGARPGAFVVLHIEDTGTGIAPEVVARMWEPFFTTKDVGKGTGLGLPTVRAIIESHLGFVQFRTKPGRGTCFRVHLPAAEVVKAEGAAPASQPLPHGRGELILVVDDERTMREMTQAMLERNGYRAIIAGDGAEATAVFAQHAAEIRLVITDLQMPNLDGRTLCRVLRRHNPALKLLAFSGLATPGEAPDAGITEYVDAFLPKPFRPEILVATVHALLRPPAGSSAPWSATT